MGLLTRNKPVLENAEAQHEIEGPGPFARSTPEYYIGPAPFDRTVHIEDNQRGQITATLETLRAEHAKLLALQSEAVTAPHALVQTRATGNLEALVSQEARANQLPSEIYRQQSAVLTLQVDLARALATPARDNLASTHADIEDVDRQIQALRRQRLSLHDRSQELKHRLDHAERAASQGQDSAQLVFGLFSLASGHAAGRPQGRAGAWTVDPGTSSDEAATTEAEILRIQQQLEAMRQQTDFLRQVADLAVSVSGDQDAGTGAGAAAQTIAELTEELGKIRDRAQSLHASMIDPDYTLREGPPRFDGTPEEEVATLRGEIAWLANATRWSHLTRLKGLAHMEVRPSESLVKAREETT